MDRGARSPPAAEQSKLAVRVDGPRRHNSGVYSAAVRQADDSERMYRSSSHESQYSKAKFERVTLAYGDRVQVAQGQPSKRDGRAGDHQLENRQQHGPRSCTGSAQDDSLDGVPHLPRNKIGTGPGSINDTEQQDVASKVHVIRKNNIIFQSGQDELPRKLGAHNKQTALPRRQGTSLKQLEGLRFGDGEDASPLNGNKELEPRVYSVEIPESYTPTSAKKTKKQSQFPTLKQREESLDSGYAHVGKEMDGIENSQDGAVKVSKQYINKEERAGGSMVRNGFNELSQSA